MSSTVQEFLQGLDACDEGIRWASDYETIADIWKACPRGDWLLWLLYRTARLDNELSDSLILRKFGCRLLREAVLTTGRPFWDLLEDKRSRDAVAYLDTALSDDLLAPRHNITVAEANRAASDAKTDAGKCAADAVVWILSDCTSTACETVTRAFFYEARGTEDDYHCSSEHPAVIEARRQQANLLREVIPVAFIEELSDRVARNENVS